MKRYIPHPRSYWPYLACFALCFGCRSTKPIVLKNSKETVVRQTDSTATRSVQVDSLMLLRRADSTRISALLGHLTPTGLTSSSNGITATLSRTGDRIDCECHTEELWQMISWQKQVIERFLTKETETQDQKEVLLQEPKAPWYQHLLTWFGLGALGLFAWQIWLNRPRPGKVGTYGNQ
jgi:hypothetical protein